MREIKFRAWDKACNVMVMPNDMHIYLNGTVSISQVWATNDLILMQYTGIKDKNGKEIYEGDIVRNIAKDGEIECLGAIEGPRGDDAVDNWVWCGFGHLDSCLSHWKYEPEVVGNIYENPDML